MLASDTGGDNETRHILLAEMQVAEQFFPFEQVFRIVLATLFAFATQGWMMFLFLVPYCLGGISGPALQAIISLHVPKNEQGELQGSLTG